MNKSMLLLACVMHCALDVVTARNLANPLQHELFKLTIVHINDFHARFVQTSPTSSICEEEKENQCVGGLSRLVTVTRQLFNEKKNSIFLNAGDYYQGTVWYSLFKWNVTAHFMNKLPHDALTIGNHEFDDDVEGLVPFLQQVRAPVVVANIDASEEPTMKGLYENSTIIVRGNRTIGVTGLIMKTVDTLSHTGKLKFLDEIESINAEAERLKARGVNIIIVLSHVGLDIDRVIAANCPDVDVIVGGHSHTFLYSGKPPFIDTPVDQYPVVIKQNKTNRTVLIVQAAAYNKYLGNLTVWFDGQGEVVDWEGNPIFLASHIEEDPETLEELKPWADVVTAVGQKVVGETKTFLSGSCGSGECNMANLVTDAMIHAHRNKSVSPDAWTYAAISCINAAGMRADIAPGNVTFGDLKTVLPFELTWDVVELKGVDLRLALEESVSRGNNPKHFHDAGFLHWSGIRVVYNLTEPAWSRIQSLSVRCQECKEPSYEPLNPDKSYRVVVVSFVIEGGDGLTIIAGKHRHLQQGPVDVNAFEDYVESISPFSYKLEQRVQLVS